jgi:hypothetical protein
MSCAKHCLGPPNVVEINVGTCRDQVSSFLSLKPFHQEAKDHLVGSFLASQHSELSEVEVPHCADVQCVGNFLQRDCKPHEGEWLARALKNKIWECDCGLDFKLSKSWLHCPCICKCGSGFEGKQIPHKFPDVPSSGGSETLPFTVWNLEETEDLQMQEKEMFELSAHTFQSSLALIGLILTSLLLCFVCLFL